MLMHVMTQRGYANSIREPALKADSGTKIPYHTRDGHSNPRQYCTWLLSQMLYQLSIPRPLTLLKHDEQARKYAHQKKGGKRPCLKILPALPIIGKQLVFADFAHQELPLDQGQPHLLHDLHHVFCAFLWGIFKPADHSCVDILFFANLE